MSWSAHLPMYDLPELRDRNDALWQAAADVLRDAGFDDVPSVLGGSERSELFTQVCGFPLHTTQRGRYVTVGTPMYDVDGCTQTLHRAFIIVADDAPYESPENLRGTRFAVNDPTSNTGMNLPRRYFARLARGAPFFSRVTLSGSHVASIEQVASGRADSAAVDCVTYAFVREVRPELARRVRVLAQTDPSPAIPFVTVDDGDVERIAALRGAVARLARERRFAPALRALHITGIQLLGNAAYAILGSYEREAIEAGYPILR